MANDLSRSIKIYIDNSDALASAQKLETKIASLRGELQQLAAEGKKEDAAYLSKEKALRKYEKTYGNYQNKIKETERILKNLSGSTYKELLSVKRTLQRELQKEERGTVSYAAKLKAYHAVQKEITVAQREMNLQYGKTGTLMSRMANGFNKYFTMGTTFIASITGVSFALRKFSQDAAKMDDRYADVQKTTGLTHKEVEALNESFKKMDTRTAREELNRLARDAGKLGLQGKEDVLEFVEAGNQIDVALGEDLGEEAIRNIGKITEVFKRSTNELESMGFKDRMLAVGSAINDLGQSSTANEAYLVDFTQRLGGVAAQAGISVQNILGYASALDQSGMKVEVAGTAMQKFIMQIMGNSAKFARIAGYEVKHFSNLLKKDANYAIKIVLKSLSEKGGFQQLIPVFEQMGLNGARAVGVLSSLATNIHLVDEAQRVSNKAFAYGNSVTKEYNIKNNNLMAQLEKRKKEFKEAALELGARLNPALLQSTKLTTRFVRILPAILDFFSKYGPALLKITTLIVAYNLGIKAQVMWTKLALIEKGKLFIANGREVAQQTILALKYVLSSRSATQLNRSLKALWATMKLNPVGLVTALIIGLGYAVYKLMQNNSKLLTQSAAMVGINKKVAESTGHERAELDMLLAVARNEKISKDERLKAIRKLNEISPEYLGNLNLENINTDEARISVEKYTRALLENAKQKAITDNVSELYSQKIHKEAEISQMPDTVTVWVGGSRGGGSYVEQDNMVKKRKQAEIDDINKEIDVYTKLNQQLLENKNIKSKDLDQNSYTAIEYRYIKAQEELEKLESKHAELYNKINKSDSGVLKQDDSGGLNFSEQTIFADQEQLKLLTSKLAKQREITAARKREFEMAKKGTKADKNDNNSPATPTVPDKSAYKEKIAALEVYIEKEKNILRQKHLDNRISYEQYQFELEQLEMDALNRQLQLYISDDDKRQVLIGQIMNKQIATRQKMNDILLTSEKVRLEKEAALRKKADDARAKQNWKTLKTIAKQNEDNYKKEFERRNKQRADLVELGMDFANDMGELVAGAVMGNEDIVASSLKSLINMGLDFLKVQVQMAVAGATAQSLASPESVATFGAAGLAKAAILVGLIEAAFAVVKGVVGTAIGKLGGSTSSSDGGSITTQRVVTQRAAGKYDVIGANDGLTYTDVPYVGAVSGIVPHPTLVGEYGPELVVSAPDLVRLQRHVNYPLVVQAIQQSRVAQRASGNYESLPALPLSPTPQGFDNNLLSELRDLLLWLKTHGIEASVNYHEFQKADDTIKYIKSKAARQ